LIHQQILVLAKNHPVHIFDNESFRLDPAQDSIKLSVEVVTVVALPVPFSALRIPLAWIASDQEIGGWKPVKISNVSALNLRVLEILFVSVTSSLPNIVRPDYVVASSFEGIIRTATASE